MEWITLLFKPEGVANAVLILSLVGALGLALGSIRVLGISLGIGGVLFSGLLFGHYGYTINPEMMDFAKDFGLILFVYTIGMQVGPGFFSSLKRQGLPLNIMAACIVGLGVLITVLLKHFMHLEPSVAAGLFSGATTNTPALAAAQQALKDTQEAVKTAPGVSYAIAYPFGILGIIVTMMLIRVIFRVDAQKEAAQFLEQTTQSVPRPVAVNLKVTNPNIEGMVIQAVPMPEGDSGVVISRVMHDDVVQLAQPDTVLHVGDVILAVGPKDLLTQLQVIVGEESKVDLKKVPSHLVSRYIIVSKKAALGHTVDELKAMHDHDITITRVGRTQIEFTPPPDMKLQFGDRLLAVGEKEDIEELAQEVGNSEKELNLPQIIPVMLGLALGVLVGSWPFNVAGLSTPLKLGLAGGPLLVAIVLSRIGNIGRLVWYLPPSANLMLREIGIVLFLSCVGLKSGGQFVNSLVHGSGLSWAVYGALITFVPIFTVALVARIFLKLNFASLCGLLSGSMTDPPALAFAGQFTGSDAPYVSYATVYPLVMILRVLCAQAIILLMR